MVVVAAVVVVVVAVVAVVVGVVVVAGTVVVVSLVVVVGVVVVVGTTRWPTVIVTTDPSLSVPPAGDCCSASRPGSARSRPE